MLFSVSMDGKLVVRKAIFRLRRRDARARFCAGVIRRHGFVYIALHDIFICVNRYFDIEYFFASWVV